MLNDENEYVRRRDPVLFDPSLFDIVDPKQPNFWVVNLGKEGERYCYPEEWSEVGFFEDFHDRVQYVIDIFWDVVERRYPHAWKDCNKF